MSVGSKNEGTISKQNFGKGDSIEWLALFGCVKLRFDISEHSTHFPSRKDKEKGDSLVLFPFSGCVKLRFDISEHSTHYQAEKIRRKGTALSYSRFLLLPVRVNSIHRNLEVRIGIETLNQFNDFSRNLEPLKCINKYINIQI